jgi:type IV pilus assembly protein PilY1
LYGIYDANSNTNTDIVGARSTNLQQQSVTNEFTQSFGTNSVEVRITSNNAVGTGKKGWYLDLTKADGSAEGERMISNPKIRNGRITFVTIVPGADPCNPGGKTRLTQLDAASGSRLDTAPFDLNADGTIDTSDLADVTLSNNTHQQTAVSSITVQVDYGTTPGVIAGSNADYYYISGDDRDRTGPNPLGGDDIFGVQGSPGDNAHGRQSWRQLR